MARIRTIKPKFWDDIKLSKISRDARLLFIGMWNFSDDLGVINSDIIWLKSKVFPYDEISNEQFDGWLQELQIFKFVLPIFYNDEHFFFVRTFHLHQKINRPNDEEAVIRKDLLISILDKQNIIHGLIIDNSVNVHGAFKQKTKKSLPYTLIDNTHSNGSINSKKIEENNTDKGEKKIEKNEEHFPTEKNINEHEISETKIGAVVQLFKITKQVDVSNQTVLDLWAVFKTQNFTGTKFYQDNNAVVNHFINWCKNQNIQKNGQGFNVGGINGRHVEKNGKSAGAAKYAEQLREQINAG